MNSGRSSISNASSYQEMGAFWDEQDLGEIWDQTEAIHFDVEVRSTRNYYALETGLSTKLRSVAEQRGVSPETLLNLWVQEKMAEALVAAEAEAAQPVAAPDAPASGSASSESLVRRAGEL